VSPPSVSKNGRRNTFIISYVPSDNNESLFEHIALKLDVSLKLMNTTVAGMEDVIFSRFRRSSVNQQNQFALGKTTARTDDIAAGEENKEDPDDVNDNDDFVLNSSPLQGFHTPASFRARVWRSVEHIDFGRVLVRILFGTVILKRKMYPRVHNIEEKFVMFLIRMTADCTTRPMYVSVIAKLCISIPTIEDIKDKSDFIDACVTKPDQSSTIAHIEAHRGDSTVIATEIVRAYKYLSDSSTKTCKYSGWTDEKKYQCVRTIIFY